MNSFLINAPQMFSPADCLLLLNRSSRECLFCVENQKVSRVVFLEGRLLLLDILFRDSNSIEIFIKNTAVDKAEREAIRKFVNHWLGLEDDLVSFYQMAAADSVLGPLTQRYRGLRLIGIPDLFEALSWAIIGQQINLGFAYTIKKRLVEHYGEKLHFSGKTYYHFPGPEIVANIPFEDLLKLKFSRQKAEYIIGTAESILSGKLSEQELRGMSYEEAKTSLTALRGIGNWSADYVLMKTFKHPQAFPIQDAGLLNALKKALDLNTKPSIDQIKEISMPWHGHEALATFYLWRSLMD